MKYEEAEKIINDYGSVLTNGELRSVYPNSLLPYPKEKIKEAIKSFYTGCTVTGVLEPEDQQQLEIAYKTLAIFIKDDKANLFVDYDRWITTHKNQELKIADAKKYKIASPETNNEMAEIQKNIRIEMVVLASEFGQIVKSVECFRKDTE